MELDMTAAEMLTVLSDIPNKLWHPGTKDAGKKCYWNWADPTTTEGIRPAFSNNLDYLRTMRTIQEVEWSQIILNPTSEECCVVVNIDVVLL
jgi:hypothetical protein